MRTSFLELDMHLSQCSESKMTLAMRTRMYSFYTHATLSARSFIIMISPAC